ncbi:MAG: uracil-DNA glycosylase [Syntrophaceae bacterium]
MSRKHGPMPDKQTRTANVNCLACRHFFITYNPRFPYGCRAVGFKSRLLPAQEMYRNSGFQCQLFEDKAQEH